MKRLLLIPFFALVLTLASLWFVWRPFTWGLEEVGYGFPMSWLTSFSGGLGLRWQTRVVNLVADYLFWLEMSAAGAFSIILLQRKRSVEFHTPNT
jgi:hypothetical protein